MGQCCSTRGGLHGGVRVAQKPLEASEPHINEVANTKMEDNSRHSVDYDSDGADTGATQWRTNGNSCLSTDPEDNLDATSSTDTGGIMYRSSSTSIGEEHGAARLLHIPAGVGRSVAERSSVTDVVAILQGGDEERNTGSSLWGIPFSLRALWPFHGIYDAIWVEEGEESDPSASFMSCKSPRSSASIVSCSFHSCRTLLPSQSIMSSIYAGASSCKSTCNGRVQPDLLPPDTGRSTPQETQGHLTDEQFMSCLSPELSSYARNSSSLLTARSAAPVNSTRSVGAAMRPLQATPNGKPAVYAQRIGSFAPERHTDPSNPTCCSTPLLSTLGNSEVFRSFPTVSSDYFLQDTTAGDRTPQQASSALGSLSSSTRTHSVKPPMPMAQTYTQGGLTDDTALQSSATSLVVPFSRSANVAPPTLKRGNAPGMQVLTRLSSFSVLSSRQPSGSAAVPVLVSVVKQERGPLLQRAVPICGVDANPRVGCGAVRATSVGSTFNAFPVGVPQHVRIRSRSAMLQKFSASVDSTRDGERRLSSVRECDTSRRQTHKIILPRPPRCANLSNEKGSLTCVQRCDLSPDLCQPMEDSIADAATNNVPHVNGLVSLDAPLSVSESPSLDRTPDVVSL